MPDLMDIQYKNDLKFASFHITNMYTNIPTQKLRDVTKYLHIHNNVDWTTQAELQRICNTVLTQNHFRYNNTQYSQTQGLAMGAPHSSSRLSEVNLHFLENNQLYDIVIQHQFIGYFRYVDDILIVYSENNRGIHKVLDLFNNISPTLTFTVGKERSNCINFLDNSICNNQKISFSAYRKPTATVITIPKDSNCHKEQQLDILPHD